MNSNNPPLIKKNKNKPADLREKIAELPSLYSNTEGRVISITANLYSAKISLLLIYISLYFEKYETTELTRNLAQKAFLQNYNGEWRTVQDFLELELQTPEDFEREYFLVKGTHDFYGNFLPRAVRILRIVKQKDLTRKDQRPVKYPEFRRGYRDHGSLRLPSDTHGIKPYSSREREDRRALVSHPYLREKTEEVRKTSSEHVSDRKEETFNVTSRNFTSNSYHSYPIPEQTEEYETSLNGVTQQKDTS